jgi:FdhD protein
MQKGFLKKLIKNHRAYKYCDGEFLVDKIPIIEERVYKIFVNGEKLTSVMLLPYYETEFIYGFLLTSSLINSINDIVSCRLCDNNNFHIYLRNNKNVITSDSMLGNRYSINKYFIKNEELLPVDSNISVSALELLQIYQEINNEYKINNLNKGIDGCIFYKSNDNYITCIDTDWNNVLNKIIGYKMFNNLDDDGIIFTTVKITGEIIHKCIKAKLPIVVTTSTVSSMAIELSSKFNITLVGLLNDDTFIVFVDKIKRIANGI